MIDDAALWAMIDGESEQKSSNKLEAEFTYSDTKVLRSFFGELLELMEITVICMLPNDSVWARTANVNYLWL